MIRLFLIFAIPILAFIITVNIIGCNNPLISRWYRTGNSSGFYNYQTSKSVIKP